jgi:hypothetical protein
MSAEYNIVLPIEKFLPSSAERPDLIDVMYEPTEIVNPLSAEEFYKIEVSQEYLAKEEERELKRQQYAKEVEERAERLRKLELETGKNPLIDDPSGNEP